MQKKVVAVAQVVFLLVSHHHQSCPNNTRTPSPPSHHHHHPDHHHHGHPNQRYPGTAAGPRGKTAAFDPLNQATKQPGVQVHILEMTIG